MATSKLNEVIQYLRRTVLLRDGAGLSDAQLMDEYLSHREGAALEALVKRHGPMVWGVCLRLLRNKQDAEDAFQATFLVLVRKAASVVPKEMVGNWLYGVAHQTAQKVKAIANRRRKRERQVIDMPEPEVPKGNLWHDLQPILDQELSRLPDKYRAAIVLCDLEGKSRKEAAKQLGLVEGTMASRLARARTMLAKRLARHGIGASGGALAAVISQNAALACAPPLVVSSTMKAVSLVAAGKVATGVISAKVAAVTEGVVKTMLLTKLKTIAAVLVVGSVFVLGGGVLLNGTAGGQQDEVRKNGGEKPAVQQAAQLAEKPKAEKKDSATAKTEHQKLMGKWRAIERNNFGLTRVFPKDTYWYIGKDRIVMNPQFLSPTETSEQQIQASFPWDERTLASYHFWGDNGDDVPAPNNINMTMQWVRTSPKKKDVAVHSQTLRGTYVLDGDRLKLCFRPKIATLTRPTRIPDNPAKEDLLHIWVLQRETAAPNTDEDKLQGDWKVISDENNGQRPEIQRTLPDGSQYNAHISFVGDLMIDITQGEKSFKLDTTKAPKQISSTVKSEPFNTERKVVGIYSLNGDDLRICHGLGANFVIPDDFAAGVGSNQGLLILKREKTSEEFRAK